MSEPQKSSNSAITPTILTHLHALLQSHQVAHPQATLPYLHPYAPSSSSAWKGKSREVPLSALAQPDTLRQVRETIAAAKGLLGRSGGKDDERERVKLARALKEVTTHQSTLLPLSSSLASRPTSLPEHPVLTSSLVLLPPIELLTSLARKLSIQTYLEDSQFGLLKTSLALAGNRFVIDVDLETDAVGNDEDDEDVDVEKRMEGRGRVRLSKLTVNHVGPSGSTVKSDWIASVLRGRLEGYLDAWNEGDRAKRLEALIRGLEGELRDLKALDDLVVGIGERDASDYFADLEEIAGKVRGSPSMLQTQHWTIFPTFRLLDMTSDLTNPVFRLRPSRAGEAVTIPTLHSDDMVVDEKPWITGSWVVEDIGNEVERPAIAMAAGIPVRRSWLSQATEDEDLGGTWDALVKIEQLMWAQQPHSVFGPAFPYTSDFVAQPALSKGEPSALAQRWSMAQPGPEGFIVGRVGVSSIWTDFERAILALRNQIILNQLFSSVFKPSLLERGREEDGSDSDEEGSVEDLDDLLSVPKAMPLTVTLFQRSVRIAFPLPHQSPDESTVTLVLRISPSSTDPALKAITWQVVSGGLSDNQTSRVRTAVATAKEGGRDLVDVVRRLEQSLRSD